MTADRPSQRPRRPVATDVFQAVSYLQYPSMLVGLGYSLKPLVTGLDGLFDDMNYALLYMGIGIGFSSLQDPTRTQNEVSRRIWQDPRKGAALLWILAIYAFGMIAAGLVGSYLSRTSALEQLSMGLVAFGIGLFGMLKTAIEMFEHHRLDKQPADGTGPALESEA
jgi:hypothetical protein